MFSENNLSVFIGLIIIILALHLLLQGIDFRKKIYLYFAPETFKEKSEKPKKPKKSEKKEKNEKKKLKENFNQNFNQDFNQSCKVPPVVASNRFINNENDVNFQSNVLNTNRFYKKNIQDEPLDLENPTKNSFEDQLKKQKINQYNNQPTTWKYKNEFPMNGGIIFGNVTGFDNLVDQTHKALSDSDVTSCNPAFGLKRGALVNDDLRLGLGKLGLEKRLTT